MVARASLNCVLGRMLTMTLVDTPRSRLTLFRRVAIVITQATGNLCLSISIEIAVVGEPIENARGGRFLHH